MRKSFKQKQLANNQNEIPTIGLITTQAAFTYGQPWLEELKTVLETNIDLLTKELSEKTNIEVMKPEGTYLVWLDFSAYDQDHNELGRLLKEEAKVVLNNGITFGSEGEKHFRFNVATPTKVVAEGVKRLVSVFGNKKSDANGITLNLRQTLLLRLYLDDIRCLRPSSKFQ